MLKIDRSNQSLSKLATPSFADSSITERYDLQEFIKNSPDEFFREIGEELFLIGTEITPSKNVADRIDLLAVDKNGQVVVVELKRGSNKLQMLQVISYAGMISHWTAEDVQGLLNQEQQDELSDFIDCDSDLINDTQRVILIAEGYDYALLAGAQWLSENYGVDIICCRVAMATDTSQQAEYLTCSVVYPARELFEEAKARGRGPGRSRTNRWADWDTALENIENEWVVKFFRTELAAGREDYLRKRAVRFQSAGRRSWGVHARREHAYVWQHRRFENDVDYWRQRISSAESVGPVKDDKSLRFNLVTREDFEVFLFSVAELETVHWLKSSDESGDTSHDQGR
jgi:hypothetical protein